MASDKSSRLYNRERFVEEDPDTFIIRSDRRLCEQCRWILGLKVVPDVRSAVQPRAVVQLQHGHRAVGVDRLELRAQLLSGTQIHLHGFNVQSFFGDEDSRPSGRGGRLAIVEFHEFL